MSYQCATCSTSLSEANWIASHAKKKHRVCRDCWRDYSKRKYGKNGPFHKDHLSYVRAWRLKVKVEVAAHYGNGTAACVKCGFNDIRALSIDHIMDDGAAHRKAIGTAGNRMSLWLKSNGFPDGFQTLCMNCQFIKQYQKSAERALN